MEDVLYHAQLSKDLENEFTKITVKDKDIEKYYLKFPEYHSALLLREGQ